MKGITTFRLCVLFFLFAWQTGIYAVPANPNPICETLPDGTLITYYIKGDEKVHWVQSPDGYTLLRNDRNEIVYATKDSKNDLIPSAHLYRPAGLRSDVEMRFLENTPKNLRFSSAQIETKTAIWKTAETEDIQPVSAAENKNVLCVLVGFSDKAISHAKDEFDEIMNSEVGSVKDFYRENSYGAWNLTVSVAGPYVLPNSIEYYAPEEKWENFAKEVILMVDADENIDLSECAVNGKIESFHIIFAGYGDENIDNGKQIWSHKSAFNTITLPKSKLKASGYSCSSELLGRSGNKLTTIGVICHEMGHAFGADDYYDTDYKSSGGDYLSTGYWDLMSAGSWNGGGSRDGSVPAHFNMFQKILLGWVTPIELTSPLIVTDMPNSTDNAVAYRLKPYTNNEMYILENRQRTGYNASVPGNGLLIYHIHNAASKGRIDNDGHPQQAYVVCASASTAIPTATVSSYGSINSSGAPFASSATRNEFSGTSVPQMFRWTSSTGTGNPVVVTDKPLTEITQKDGLISFKYNWNEGSSILNLQSAHITVYPNPVKDVLNIQSDVSVNIAVLDINGKEIYRERNINNHSLPFYNHAPGIYLLRLQTGNAVQTIKIIKQ